MHTSVHHAGTHPRASCFSTGPSPCTKRYYDSLRAARMHRARRLASLEVSVHATACSMTMAAMMRFRVVCEATAGGSGAVPGDEHLDPELLAEFKELVDRTEEEGVRDMLLLNQINLVKNYVVSKEALQVSTRQDLQEFGLSKAAAGGLKVAFPSPIATGGLSISRLFEQPLPELNFMWGSPGETTSYQYSTPMSTIEEWITFEGTLLADAIDSQASHWLGTLSQRPEFRPARRWEIGTNSAGGVESQFTVAAMEAVQKALRLGKEPAAWKTVERGLRRERLTYSYSQHQKQQEEEEEEEEGEEEVYSNVDATELEVEGQGLFEKPGLQLCQGDSCLAYVEIKAPNSLAAVGTTSLAAAYASGVPSKQGRRSEGAPLQQRQSVVEDVSGQVEALCRDMRVRYCALSTYQVTWLVCIEGDRMLVSPGFAWNGRTPTVLQALLWLSLQAVGPRGWLLPTELPPAGNMPASGTGDGGGSRPAAAAAAVAAGAAAAVAGAAADGVAAAVAGAAGADSKPTSTTSSSGGGADDASVGGADGVQASLAGTGKPSRVLQWRAVLPSPGGGVVGTGITGEVLAARLGGQPAVVKYAPSGSEDADALVQEARVYQAPGMQAIQGVHIPRLLHAGPASGSRYVLVTSRVFGRHLDKERDADLLPQALAALRAVHSAGYLHGDVRLPNFMVTNGDDGPRVVLLDFGRAKLCSSAEAMNEEEEEDKAWAMEEEEAELCWLLGRPEDAAGADSQ